MTKRIAWRSKTRQRPGLDNGDLEIIEPKANCKECLGRGYITYFEKGKSEKYPCGCTIKVHPPGTLAAQETAEPLEREAVVESKPAVQPMIPPEQGGNPFSNKFGGV